MDSVVQAAGTALAQAIATDAWQQVKQAVAGLWRRAHPGRTDRVADELDGLRLQVFQARADGESAGQQTYAPFWNPTGHFRRLAHGPGNRLAEFRFSTIAHGVSSAVQARERIEEALIVPHAGCAHTFLASLMAPVTSTT
jgi:hypothetical protein